MKSRTLLRITLVLILATQWGAGVAVMRAAGPNQTKTSSVPPDSSVLKVTREGRVADETAKREAQAGGSNEPRAVAPGFPVISHLQVSSNAGGESVVLIPTRQTYHATRIDGPPRLVLDFADTDALRARTYAVETSTLKAVRMAQFDANRHIVRVVAELTGDPLYRVENSDEGVRIVVAARNAQAPAGPGKPNPASAHSPANLRPTGLLQASPGHSTVNLAANATATLKLTSLNSTATHPEDAVIAAAPTQAQTGSNNFATSVRADKARKDSLSKSPGSRIPNPTSASAAQPVAAVVPRSVRTELNKMRDEVASSASNTASPQSSASQPRHNQDALAAPPTNVPFARIVPHTAPVAQPGANGSVSAKAAGQDHTKPDGMKGFGVRDPGVTVNRSSSGVEKRPNSSVSSSSSGNLPAPGKTAKSEPTLLASLEPPPHPALAGASAHPDSIRAAQAAQTLLTPEDQTSTVPDQLPKAPSVQGRYTGELISVNLKEVDLKDFFRLIHEVSGLNVVVDPNVSGTVTLVLDSVPWDQALEIVLKHNGLGKVLEGNVLRIAKLETLGAEQQQAAALIASREDMVPLVTVFRSLSYAKATTVATMLKGWTGGALSKRGTVVVDDRDNTLIVSDVPSQIPTIDDVLGHLDRKSKQIHIEARIIRANTNFSRELGTMLAGALTNPSTSTQMGGATGNGVSATAPSPATSGSTRSNTSQWVPTPGIPGTAPTINPASAAGFGVFAITNASSRYFIQSAITAAEEHDQAKTISAPSIVTQDNVLGEVIQGTQIPVQTEVNNTITVQYVNATLTLDVTPQVTADGNIFMTLKVQNAAPGALLPGSPGPEINTQAATTQVLVPDGGTVVFGGVKVNLAQQLRYTDPPAGRHPGGRKPV
jgi:type IV pilus secretin PilQ/predicted competence protein